jgi:hypothetical protein
MVPPLPRARPQRGGAARWRTAALTLVAALLGACLSSTAHAAPQEALMLPLRSTRLAPHVAAAWRRRRSLVEPDAAGGDAGAASQRTALLPLYGSVRDNGVFTVVITFGSPPQRFDVIVDTGSTLAYVPCSDCGANCGTHEARACALTAPRAHRNAHAPTPSLVRADERAIADATRDARAPTRLCLFNPRAHRTRRSTRRSRPRTARCRARPRRAPRTAHAASSARARTCARTRSKALLPAIW